MAAPQLPGAVPPVAPVPPPPPVPVPVPTAPMLTLAARFLDNRYDTESNAYGRLLRNFDPMEANAPTSNQLFELIVNEEDSNSRAIAVHFQSLTNPNLLGRVVVLHGMKKYAPSLGGTTTLWDGASFCWFGDVEEGDPPTTLGFPPDIFDVTTANGAQLHRVYDAPTLQQLFNTQPALRIAPAPQAGDAGTSVIQVRYGVPIPFRYVSGLLSSSYDARSFFEVVYGQITAEGREVEMAPLIRWMCASCTARSTNVNPGDLISTVGHNDLMVPPADSALRAQRRRLLRHKLPALNTPPVPGALQGVTNMLGNLVNEFVGTREDAKARAEAVNPPSKWYGATLQKHTRLAQVATESALEPIHHAVAGGKKSHLRTTQQSYFDALCSLNGLPHLQLPITPKLSQALNEANFYSSNIDDKSQGIHPFMMGGNTPMEIKTQQDTINAYDLAVQSAGATFQDLRLVMADKDISLQTSHTFAQIDLQRFKMLLQLYWGNNTAVQALEIFLEEYKHHVFVLATYQPRIPGHDHLVPAMVLNHFHAYFNWWVYQQQQSDAVIPFPSGLSDIWQQLALKQTQWERPFSYQYTGASNPLPPPSYDGGSGTGGTPVGTGSSLPGATPTPTKKKQETQRNLYPNGNEEAFKVFRARIKTKNLRLKDIVNEGERGGNPVPRNARGDEMCATFHILGQCNNLCSRRADHHDCSGGKVHTPAEDKTLLQWCGVCVPE